MLTASAVLAADFQINEVMLRNDVLTEAAFLDEDGERQPFVELENTTTQTKSLLDWSLGRSAADPDPFVLPDVSVLAGERVVVWLSGKDRATAGSPLHADFDGVDAADLYLFDDGDQLVDSFAGQHMPLDHAMGRCTETGGTDFYYMASPSPGEANHYHDVVPFVFLEDHVSLTVGEPVQLRVWPDVPVTWSSDNANIVVSPTGVISAAVDVLFPQGRGKVTATWVGSTYSRYVQVTIVNWTANVSRLELHAQSVADRVLADEGGSVRYNIGTTLYESSDALRDPVVIGTLPALPGDISGLHSTPFGHFLNVGTNIYRSTDLTNWTLEVVMQTAGLAHGFDTHWDVTTQTGYVFAGEYSVDTSQRHRVHRGTYPNAAAPVWDIVLDFATIDEWTLDPSVLDAVRHIHVVTVDPYTGDVYVGTGDGNEHSRIYHSSDFGSNFDLLGFGTQEWRTLAIWFTEDFAYWNMDASDAQVIRRIPRTEYVLGVGWPSLNPVLTSGSTVTGRTYYVTENDTPAHFPVGVGEFFVEVGTTLLDPGNAVRPTDDPAFDYREDVAEIVNGGQWYQGFATSEQGDEVSIVSVQPNPFHRDYRSRLIGIKEAPNGDPIVQELTLVEPEALNWTSDRTVLIPKAQGADGLIYFAAKRAAHTEYVARLDWWDDAVSAPPKPTPPAPPVDRCWPAPEPGMAAMWAAGLPLVAWMARRRSARRSAA